MTLSLVKYTAAVYICIYLELSVTQSGENIRKVSKSFAIADSGVI